MTTLTKEDWLRMGAILSVQDCTIREALWRLRREYEAKLVTGGAA